MTLFLKHLRSTARRITPVSGLTEAEVYNGAANRDTYAGLIDRAYKRLVREERQRQGGQPQMQPAGNP